MLRVQCVARFQEPVRTVNTKHTHHAVCTARGPWNRWCVGHQTLRTRLCGRSGHSRRSSSSIGPTAEIDGAAVALTGGATSGTCTASKARTKDSRRGSRDAMGPKVACRQRTKWLCSTKVGLQSTTGPGSSTHGTTKACPRNQCRGMWNPSRGGRVPKNLTCSLTGALEREDGAKVGHKRAALRRHEHAQQRR